MSQLPYGLMKALWFRALVGEQAKEKEQQTHETCSSFSWEQVLVATLLVAKEYG